MLARGQRDIKDDSRADDGSSSQLALDCPALVIAGGVLPADGSRAVVVPGDDGGRVHDGKDTAKKGRGDGSDEHPCEAIVLQWHI
jgi:hypothetical protein